MNPESAPNFIATRLGARGGRRSRNGSKLSSALARRTCHQSLKKKRSIRQETAAGWWWLKERTSINYWARPALTFTGSKILMPISEKKKHSIKIEALQQTRETSCVVRVPTTQSVYTKILPFDCKILVATLSKRKEGRKGNDSFRSRRMVKVIYIWCC